MLVQVPWEAPIETTDAPAGKELVSTTPVAVAGPLFVTVADNVIGNPTPTLFVRMLSDTLKSAVGSPGISPVFRRKTCPPLVRNARRPGPQATRFSGVPATAGMVKFHIGANVFVS